MSEHLTNWRLWLWLGRFMAIAVIAQSLKHGVPFAGFFACACAYGLAQYFREHPTPQEPAQEGD